MAVLTTLALTGSSFRRERRAPPVVRVQPAQLLADGYDTAILSMETSAADPPRIRLFSNPHGATIETITGGEGKWQALVRAGVLPGRIYIRVAFPGYPPATTELTALPDARDSSEDGTPDSLRLDDDHDRAAFRRWFTYLGELQYFQSPEARPAEIDDCAALIRYAYREALRAHDGAWADGANLPMLPAFDSVTKYQYPYTPLGAALFRVRRGPFRESDAAGGAFLQFANAQTLWTFNTYTAGRSLAHALPGDLLFFRHRTGRMEFHSMIYLGPSQIRPDGRRYVLYHTGPSGANPGEIRRLTVEEISQFPQAEWRPLASNPDFLGVSRWNILRKGREESDAQD
jgi:uncharacterized protein YfaT (DUF1175 family)